ncbi:hypothetical protein VHEMI08231 [[Torrubiella] hemipterigena]|uniref:Tat pathway signal sequence n=1 Tax=[Torrubiella] hemipterigena TaxID=1531966 RepID=A0A0A1TN33_9HYPO|nr:hypothetical protein VHEMI08231 [[Torrubiella] hemipterigena]
MAEYSKIDLSSSKERGWATEEDDAESALLQNRRIGPSRSSTWHWLREERRTVTLHAIFLLSNILALMAYASGWLSIRNLSDPHSKTPMRHVISYESRPFALQSIYLANGTINPTKSNNFNGQPRPELESAWEELMQHQNVRVHQDELGDFAHDDSVVKLADGSGEYYSTVAVFHGLHCIQRLQKSMYPETYYPGLTKEEIFTLQRHTEHCLDWLREYLMCNADTSLIPIQWSSDSPGPIATDTGKHQCVVWEPVYNWMASRAFNPSQPGMLVHPIFGDAYNKSSEHNHALGITPLGHGGVLHVGHNEHSGHDGHDSDHH